ncbi:MAG: succinate dehydrogenase assembly factor 2 [Rhodospirillales bacterium]|nr:succinate dehydrogenase assembly factor 2 [Rhodospirillales bacterium]MDE0379983.1 succinate dehydrogenase assembly factor 2 [Rhodospirillales bacterium]
MTQGLDIETRRRRLRYRSARTGTKETDLLVGDVIASLGDALPPEEVAQAERLLAANDVDITNWISGRTPVPAEHDTPFMARLRREARSRRRRHHER